MKRLPDIWTLLVNFMPRNKWLHITKIYSIVENHAKLDHEDFEPQSPTSNIPKWKRNTRNVLQYKVLGILDGIEKQKNIYYLRHLKCECLLLLN